MPNYPAPARRFPLNRRQLLRGTIATGTASLFPPLWPPSAAARDKVELKGRIQQSVVFWCFNSAGEKWDVDKTCQVAKELGCRSVELVDPAQWGVLKKYGLICALAPNGMPGAPFVKGFNNPK